MLLSTPHHQAFSPPDLTVCRAGADQRTLVLWAGCHAALVREGANRSPLVDLAAALLLDQLRTCLDLPSLLTRYQHGDRDRGVVEQILPAALVAWYDVRDAAFYLRWRELVAGDPPTPA